ncbi:MAG: hypothetical protein RLO06_15120 [Parvibaculum sp.]
MTFSPDAADRVNEIVRRERECCAFLTFTLHPEADSIRLLIEAPEGVRDALDTVFQPFEAPETATEGCNCGTAGRHAPAR